MIVYQIKNILNEKSYIGYSTKFNSEEEFQKSNYWGSGILIQQSIKKYGYENFERKVLLKNILNKKELKRYEILWIKKRSTKRPKGYNLTDGGDGCIDPAKETREKMKERWIGEKNPNFGKKLPWVSLMNSQRIGKNHPLFGRYGDNHPCYGKQQNDTTKQKIKESLKEYYDNHPEEKEKISKRMSGQNHPRYGYHLTDKEKQNLREKNTGENNSNFGKSHSLETKEKIKIKLKEYWKNKKCRNQS